MCGIAGWINLKESLEQGKEIIESMLEHLANRGPDASGIWTSTHALIGHRRLIVVDPSGGQQPMVRRRENFNYIITYNGELYNTAELRSELQSRGHVFTSSSDTEVLLVSYIEWGPACVEHLNGIYAFGVWSEKDRSLFLARDRFGVKPLFYAHRGNSFIFASELKALLAHPMLKAEIGRDGLCEIFGLGPARTPGNGVFRDVYEVKPACCLYLDSNGVSHKKYWSLESRHHEDSLDTTVQKLGGLVQDAIVRQLAADVPVCTFLSGGLDSSAITALAARKLRQEGSELHTFSIDYVDNELYFKPSAFQPNSDAPWVERVSKHFGTIHHYIKFDTPQVASALKDAVLARDLPGMADVDSSLWLFCREVKKHATVALSGECADEVFGGYPWFHRADMLEADTFPWSVNTGERLRIMSPEFMDYIKPLDYIRKRYEETLAEVPALPGESPSEARRREMFYLNFTWFMQTLLDRKDRMSMASGLEVRVPFCDHRLVQYAWNIPWDMKMLEGREKGLLRKALSGVLPDDVLWRKKSPYPKTHNPSYEAAVKKELLEIIEDENSPIIPLINVNELRKMAKTAQPYDKPWFGQLMAGPQMFAYLIQLDVWMRTFKVTVV